MSSGFGRPNQGNGFVHLIALALVLIGLFSLNLHFQFVPFEFDASNPAFLIAMGVLGILGGVFLFLQGRTHNRYY